MILKQNKSEIVRQNSRQLLKVKNGLFILLSLFKLDSFKDIRILLLFSFENQEVIAIVIFLKQHCIFFRKSFMSKCDLHCQMMHFKKLW